MNLELLKQDFSVCLLPQGSRPDVFRPFTFFAQTDGELSLVCPSRYVPDNCEKREDGWRALRVCGTLEFSLVGILAGISSTLAKQGISLFAASTYRTDYILIKQRDLGTAGACRSRI